MFQVRTFTPPPWYALEPLSTFDASNLSGVDESENSVTNDSQPPIKRKDNRVKQYLIEGL
jgi:hypothetical protein